MKRTFAVAIFFIIYVCGKAQDQQAIQQKLTDLNCKVNYEILQINLRLADELFIQKRDSLALVNYRDSYARLNDYTFGSGCGDHGYYTLVKSNIEYRMLLLENGMDFWGLTYNMEPLNPVSHYKRFKALKAEFDTRVGELNKIIGDLGGAADKINEAEVSTAMADTERKIQEYEKNKHEVRINQHNETINLIRHNIQLLNDRQKEIETEAIASSEKIDELTDGLHDLLISGLAQAMGLPVDPTKINLEKSISDNLIDIGTHLVNTNPEIQDAIKEISGSMDQLIDIYRTADSTVRAIDQLQEDANGIYETIHKPSFENIMRIGKRIIPELPVEQLQEIKTQFEASQSFSSLLQLSHSLPDLRRVIANELLSSAGDFSALQSSLASRPQAFSKWILEGTGPALTSSIPSDRKSIVLLIALNYFSTDFFNSLSADAQGEWKKFIGEQSNADVIAWFKSATPDKLKNIVWDGAAATLPNSTKKLKIDETVNMLLNNDNVSPEFSVNVQRVQSAISSLGASANQFYMDKVPVSWLNDLSQGFFTGTTEAQIDMSNAQLYTSIMNAVNNDASLLSKVEDDLDALNVGAYFAANRHKTNPAQMAAPAAMTTNSGDRIKQSIITAGIQAAVPFVGIGGQFIANLLERGKLLRKMETLFNEQKAISKEKLISYDLLNQMIINERIAMIDKSISEVRQAYAVQLFDHYKSRVETVNRQISIVRIRIQNEKVLLYYLGEKLREEYAVLNKALLFRHSTSFFEKILGDPNNYRFAIDEDISLFKWFDNSAENSRADIHALKVYWDRIAALLEINCSECDDQTTPYAAALETDPISIKRLFPDEWANFQKAISDGKSEFDFILPILPGNQTFVYDELKKNRVRILDVRCGGLSKMGTFVKLVNASLFHPGVSYLFDGTQYGKEIFSPQEINGMEPGQNPPGNNLHAYPEPFNIDALRERWQTQRTLPFKGLEGYGLFSIYRLRMPITDKSKDLADLFLRFGFSYQPNQPSMLADARRLVIKSSFRKDIELGYNDLIALSGHKDWVKNIEATMDNNTILVAEEYLKKATFETIK